VKEGEAPNCRKDDGQGDSRGVGVVSWVSGIPSLGEMCIRKYGSSTNKHAEQYLSISDGLGSSNGTIDEVKGGNMLSGTLGDHPRQ